MTEGLGVNFPPRFRALTKYFYRSYSLVSLLFPLTKIQISERYSCMEFIQV